MTILNLQYSSNQFFELIVGETGVFDDCFKGIGVETFMLGDSDSMNAVGHADMLYRG